MSGDSLKKSKRKKFRKRRITENVSDVKQFFIQRFDPDKTGDQGLWCGECRKRVPWKKLHVRYSYYSKTDTVIRSWFCECWNMLREDDLTDLSEVYSTR